MSRRRAHIGASPATIPHEMTIHDGWDRAESFRSTGRVLRSREFRSPFDAMGR